MDFIASFSPNGRKHFQEENQIEKNKENDDQPRGILRKNSEADVSKQNTVKATSIPQLTELFGEQFLSKNTVRNPSKERNTKLTEKSGQEEKKKIIKEQKTVVAFGRTTKIDDSIPTAVKATATAKFPPIGGTAKEVAELKKTVEEHNSTITNLQEEITVLKSQYEQITYDYQYVLELLEKQNDRILKLELVKNGSTVSQGMNQNQGVDLPTNVDSTIGLPNRSTKTPAVIDSIALVKNPETTRRTGREMNEAVPEVDKQQYQKPQEPRRDSRPLHLVPVTVESSELGSINSLAKKDPEFVERLREFMKDYKKQGRSDEGEQRARVSARRDYSERRRDHHYDEHVPRVRERLTVQREYCYSPSAPLSTTIDSTLRKIPDFTREERREHRHRHVRNDHQRERQRHRHEPTTPRVEEVSEEWSSSNEEAEYRSRIYDNTPQESKIHDQTAGKENIPEMDNMEYTVMQDYYDEDDGLFETSVNARSTSEGRRRVADRLAQSRRR